jgi:hypothetical protein
VLAPLKLPERLEVFPLLVAVIVSIVTEPSPSNELDSGASTGVSDRIFTDKDSI